MKKTLIFGATTNKDRYAYKAAEQLTKAGHSIIPFGIKKGTVFGKEIINKWMNFEGIDTVTLYVGLERQNQYFEKIDACGLKDYKNTSLKEIGLNISNKEFDNEFMKIFIKKITNF